LEKSHISKIFISNPFVISIGFTIFANLIQVFAFMAQAKLDDSNFALLNWGIYVFTFLNIPIESLLRWITIRLGMVDPERRMALLIHFMKKTVVPIYVLLVIFAFPFVTIDSSSAYIGILCLLSAFLGFWSIFPRAYLNVREKFFEFNLVLLIIPIVRLIFTVLFVFNGSVYLLFFGLILSSLLATILSSIFVWKDSGINLSSIQNIIKGNEANEFDDNVTNIFRNIFLQVALTVFYIADGMILKNLLSEYDYNVYVSYSYIYRFPMFAAIGMIPVILGKAVISEDNKYKLKKTLIVSIML